jgi:hypothetical protein
MHITLVDESIPFDGYSAASRALGGAEKAFASLPGALARLGHTVHVVNKCRWTMHVEGAHWDNLEGKKPLTTDVLIAFRKPSLLEFIRHAGKRVLWFTGPGRLLGRAATRQLLEAHKPLVLLTAEAQARDFDAKGLAAALLPAAVRGDFLGGSHRPETPPRAIVTTHPAHGLDWLLDLWAAKIRPQVQDAELHIHSNTLADAQDGKPVDEAMAPLARKAMDCPGVVISRPQGDFLMAVAYQEASVHLYPGHPDDMGCFTLMESQAAGCPAVVRPLGAAPERIENGASGHVAPDDDAFANLAVLALKDAAVRAAQSEAARALYASRNWDFAAKALEGWIK